MIRASDYGRALFELARQEHREGEIGEEMAPGSAILEQQPAYARLLDSPALPREQRLSLVEEAFSSLNLYHLNFLKILCRKARGEAMPPAPGCGGSCMTRPTAFCGPPP